MARPPRRSDDGGEKRRRRRRLYILTKHYGDQGPSIYKLNEDGFDSDDAYSEHSEDSGSTSFENSEDSGSISSDDSEHSVSISSSDSESSGSTSTEDKMHYLGPQDHFDCEYDVDSRARRLRHSRLVVRLGRQAGLPEFVAAGTKILGLNRSTYHATDVSFVFDAATRLVSAAPPFQSPKKSATFWTAGGTIYALDLNSRDAGESQERCLFERLGPDPQSRYRNWRWEALPPPPFKGDRYLELKSHAVHPDGATVFLSFRNARTFSFDGERLEWARHGRWALPFDGEAYHVRELDAWVGLCSRHRGHLAACQVVGGSRRGGAAKPASKCGKDLLFRHRWKRHIDANLVYKGNAKFCLLETVTREHIDANHWDWDAADLILLRVVTFRVQYSFDGPMLLRVVTFQVAYSGDGEL
uniref:Uncharacterized protein n=1 Tax=Setaria italica TaxID=4555 RepID=K4A2F0_SETIT